MSKEQAHMDRIRASRGLPPLRSREQLMNEVAAARCYIDQACSSPKQQRRAELAAFMSIFHPEVPDERVCSMMRDVA